MAQVVFLLGAGFNADAAGEAGDCQRTYPLMSDLLKPCFNIDTVSPGQSIEQMFQSSIDSGNYQPIDRLYALVMEADYCIAQLLRPDGSHPNNVYARFLADFPTASLLTFNYDSLPEIILFGMQQWRPEDGYGIPVQVSLHHIDPSILPHCSRRSVLHLHGSLCLYPQSFFIEKSTGRAFDTLRSRTQPEFLFDPDALGPCFPPFQRIQPGHFYRHVSERGIAPVPNKASRLTDALIGATYEQAQSLLRRSNKLVVIGYSFNPHDVASYDPLLAGSDGLNIVLVGPDAAGVTRRMQNSYPRLRWEYVPCKFRDWVEQGYPGVCPE